MAVRCKFYVEKVAATGWDGQKKGEEISLRAVSGGSEENKRFWKATPNAQLFLTIENPEAWGLLEIGKEYFLDLTPA